MGAEELALLGRLDDDAARAAGARTARGRERFGLVHADIRLANLLVDGEHVRVIDFDDCGFSWFMYDFATTVSFIEDHPRRARAEGTRGWRATARWRRSTRTTRPSSTRS